jgi:O-antigen/teichoic acid export membrane protein
LTGVNHKGDGAIWIAVGQAASLVGNFALLNLLTSNLSVTSYGYFALWMAVALFVRQVLYDPISIVTAKEAIERRILSPARLGAIEVVRHATNRSWAVAVVLCVGLLVVYSFPICRNDLIACVIAAIAYLAANGAQGIYVNVLNTLKRRRVAAIAVSSDAIVKLGFVFLFLTVFGHGAIYALYAVAASAVVVFIWVRMAAMRVEAPSGGDPSELHRAMVALVVSSLPLVAPKFLVSLRDVGDRVFMASYIGIDDFAAYSVLLQIGFLPMSLLIGMIQTYAGPDIYRAATGVEDGACKVLRHLTVYLRVLILASALAVIASVLIGGPVLRLLVGEQYAQYSGFLPLFVAAGSVAGLAGLLNVAALGVFPSRVAAVLMLVSVVVGLAIHLGMIALYGFAGGAVGLLLSNAVAVIVYLWSLVAMAARGRR